MTHIEQLRLEEAAKNYINSKNPEWTPYHKQSFKDGAKWQAKRMYSEEEVYNLLEEAMKDCYNEQLEYHYGGDYINLKEWFEQHKFAKWASKYDWVFMADRNYWVNDDSRLHPKTTKELFQEYLKSKENEIQTNQQDNG